MSLKPQVELYVLSYYGKAGMTERGELLSRLLCLGTGKRKNWFALVDLVCAAYEIKVEYVLSWAEYFFCSLGCMKFLLQLEPAKRCTKKTSQESITLLL